jgi:DNA-binding transcriptional regulator YiaG
LTIASLRKAADKPEPEPTLQPDDYSQIDGDKVRQIRLSFGETQEQFGKHFNVDPSSVIQWVTNRR